MTYSQPPYPDPAPVAHVRRAQVSWSYQVTLRDSTGRLWLCSYPAHSTYWRKCRRVK